MKELLLAVANVTVNWTGPWVITEGLVSYPVPTAPAPPAVPAPVPEPLPIFAMLLALVITSIVAVILVWWYGYRKEV